MLLVVRLVATLIQQVPPSVFAKTLTVVAIGAAMRGGGARISSLAIPADEPKVVWAKLWGVQADHRSRPAVLDPPQGRAREGALQA